MSNGYNDYKEKLIYILRILNSYFIFPKKVILMHENIFLKYKIANTFEAEFKIRRIGKENDKTESKLILDFLSDFKNNISEEYLNIGLDNIKSINCYSNSFINHLFSLLCFGGLYSKMNHSIYVNTEKEESKKILYHELLHALTSFKCKNLLISGFHHKNIGQGINEGYTDLITNRLLNISEYDYKIGYPYESIVSNIVEFIIGKEKMYSLYFNGDLSGLIDILSQYSSKSNVINFIINLDNINKMSYLRLISTAKELNEDEYLNNLYIKVTKFLYELLSSKFNECHTFNDINAYFHTSQEVVNLIKILNNYTTFKREKAVIKWR